MWGCRREPSRLGETKNCGVCREDGLEGLTDDLVGAVVVR